MDFGLFSLKRASHDSPAYYPFAPNTGGISMGFARSFSLLKSSLILVAHRAWFVISSGVLWCGTTNMELGFIWRFVVWYYKHGARFVIPSGGLW